MHQVEIILRDPNRFLCSFRFVSSTYPRLHAYTNHASLEMEMLCCANNNKQQQKKMKSCKFQMQLQHNERKALTSLFLCPLSLILSYWLN